MSALQAIWFFLIGVLLTGYAVLDGFDLGAGFWFLSARKEKDRKAILASIGPFWDGNEVWLLTGGGAIFAAFPEVYATVFSGFYLAMILVLLGLILRAVSVEFRNKVPSERWRSVWDVAFSVGSGLPALLFGVAIGNILRGIPLDAAKNYTGGFWGLLNPYALVIGLLGLSMFATHGALYVAVKTDGPLVARARWWAGMGWIAWLILFIVAGAATWIFEKHLTRNILDAPVFWAIPVLALASILAVGFFNRRREEWRAFMFSSLSIVAMMALVGSSLFPNLVPGRGNPSSSLTIFNASSSALTLKVMLILALIGMPVVIGYTIWIYRVFRGKAKVEKDGY